MGGYKCASFGCYSYQSPETNALFQKLQTTVNQFAQALGFAPLKTPVDGIIGRGTTEAALYVLVSLGETDQGPVGASARALEAGISSTEQLAANAQAVTDTLVLATKQSAIAAHTTPAQPLPAPTSEPSMTQKATTTANAPVKSSSPAVQQKLNSIQAAKPALAASLFDRIPPWAAYASGAALLVGALAAAGLSMRKKRGGPASSMVSGPKTNENGLTFHRWWRAAGFSSEGKVPTAGYDAWQSGEDPSDWRAERQRADMKGSYFLH